jgi:hypothetical protein
MPPHSSHLLQPLDVGCFAVFKRAYSSQVSDLIRLGINHINKAEFLQCLKKARKEAFSLSNIHSGFAATGIVPFDPERVLSTILRATTPPLQTSVAQQHCSPTTPYNLAELRQYVRSFQDILRRLSQSPPTPINQAIQHLVKGCELSMQGAVLLAEENQRLQTANERQIKKRLLRRRHITIEKSLTVAQAS